MKTGNFLWLALLALASPGDGFAGDSGSRPLPDSLRPLYPAPGVATAARAAAEEPNDEFRAMAGEIRRIMRGLSARPAMTAASEDIRPAYPGLQVEMGPFGTPATITVTGTSDMPESEAASTISLPNETLLRQEAAAFLAKYRTLLRLEEPERELRFIRLHRDGRGHSHLRYAQSYRGVPVRGTGLILHLDRRGRVISMDGKYIPSPGGIQLTPRIDSTRAVTAAKEALKIPAGTNPPSRATLVIHTDPGSGTPALAWEIALGLSLTRRMVTLVDAGSGGVMFSYNSVRHGSVPGRGVDALGTTRALTVWREREGEYYLLDASSMGIQGITDPLEADHPNGVIRILDARNAPEDQFDPVHIGSGSAEGGWLGEGVSAAYNLFASYDYYRKEHGHDSLDGNKRSIVAIVRLGENLANAAYIHEYGAMIFGDADNFSSSLDVVGHEYTHGVTSSTSGLLYMNQSGALAEALADVFGEAIERAVTGSNDWILGTELRDPYSKRNMKQPHLLQWAPGRPYPTKMSEYVDLPLDENNGGVHINSSIINRAFYLLAEGLDDAIGMASAARIFHRANTVYLLPGSGFADMRRAAIRSAKDLYPDESSKREAVEEAFDAVEILEGPLAPQPPPREPVDAEDSVVMIIPRDGRYYLGRREKARGDPEEGVYLTRTPVQPRRPAVSANGDIVAFIDEGFDLCFIGADGLRGEECLDEPGLFHSVAVSPDTRAISYIPRDRETGEARSSICVIRLDGTEDYFCHPLRAAEMDGSPMNIVVYADAMDFTADNRFLIYDAMNRATLTSGQQIEVWSIYALDLESGTTIPMLPPMPGLDLAFPSLSDIDPALITFDAFSADGNQVFIGSLETGELVTIADTENYAIPALSGDDTALIYSVMESEYSMSLYRVGIGRESQAVRPLGEPVMWLAGGGAGVIYRKPALRDNESGGGSGGGAPSTGGDRGGGGSALALLLLLLPGFLPRCHRLR